MIFFRFDTDLVLGLFGFMLVTVFCVSLCVCSVCEFMCLTCFAIYLFSVLTVASAFKVPRISFTLRPNKKVTLIQRNIKRKQNDSSKSSVQKNNKKNSNTK
jgi:hypothetical protein